MNLPPSAINDQIVTQQPPPVMFEPQQTCLAQNQWINHNAFGSYQLPLQLSQYYNVFPDVPSTKTSWTFPNGCVTSNIVRFTGLPTPSYPIGSSMQSNQCRPCGTTPVKRKSLPVENEIQSNKIFITEEKMAARMNDMHISNELTSYSKANADIENIDEMDEAFTQSVSNTTSEPKLIICDVLKDIARDINSIIPEQLMSYEKPSTALVLWRPPASYLKVENPENDDFGSRSSVVITDITDRPDLDNNNISTVDLNTLTLPPNIEYPPDSNDAMEL